MFMYINDWFEKRNQKQALKVDHEIFFHKYSNVEGHQIVDFHNI
jgi:hypothetical protein